MKSFVDEKDISILNKMGIDYDVDIIVFINEMKDYFYKTWSPTYHSKINNMKSNTIEEFNKIIGGYPSEEGYNILSDSFLTAEEDDLDLLSEKTETILKYLYNISF